MDPDATLNALYDAYKAQDWPTVRELTGALLLWLDRGGFPPGRWTTARTAYRDITLEYRRTALPHMATA